MAKSSRKAATKKPTAAQQRQMQAQAQAMQQQQMQSPSPDQGQPMMKKGGQMKKKKC
jgi:hypothetical protein